MKHRILTTALLLLIIVILVGCTVSPTGQMNAAQEEIDLPELTQGDRTQEKERIPMLPDPEPFVNQLLQSEKVILNITMYDMNFTIENQKGLCFIMKDGKVKKNRIGAEERGSSIEGIVDTDYEVPFDSGYRFSYAYPHEDCSYRVAWAKGKLFASAWGSGIETVDCSLSGIRLTGENMEYTLKFYIRNADTAVLIVTGSGESAVCLIRTEDGFRFYCENGAHMELPDAYESKAIRELEIPAGMVGVLEGISKGYDAELYTEPFPE